MSFLNVTWKSISSIGKGQSTPGCEDSTQDLPRATSRLQPSQRILIHPNIYRVKYQQYSRKHLSIMAMPTVPGASSHHSRATSRLASQIAYISPELHPVSPTLLSESSLDSSDRLLEDFINPSYHKQGGDDSVNFWSHLTFCGTESAGRLLNVPYSNIVERLHYGSQNFVATPFTDVSVALTNSPYVSIFWKKNRGT
ncbi:hypothetical protein BU17DRAFT_68775 [Hysterangium stoloniferum]|nr:hypothetical protein BU17DRAFT_68775 [Hysterangium stoloniferum]